MKITDKRNTCIATEYKSGQVLNDGHYTYMGSEIGPNEFQLIRLSDGKGISYTRPSLEELYEKTDHYGERIVDAELIIDGDDGA
ncbi:hypothetical protein [Lactiplantibacillus plantarum]|uniref:hypothetical protein n=1 Tax=Lactiplantibacillus plantarum TaxID=1590 RepID=UPI002653077B|nr:hypothetical protein [Lactiplantibacillus plantarum]MDN7019822.1 hypothetical protein [Lactiplantibacillus plantarum]